MKESKTWWGQRFIAALCQFTDAGRLARGKAYSSDRRILDWQIKAGKVTAKIRGNKNPYFGVTREPRYTTTLSLTKIPAGKWQQLIQAMSTKASVISRLMLDEMPENMEIIFTDENLDLLPRDSRDFNVKCSCPDYSSSCKHIAGVCYRLAAILDHNPLLLFDLRGLSAEKLNKELVKHPLGKALAALREEESTPPIQESYYTRPIAAVLPEAISGKDYWYGRHSFPKQIAPVTSASIAGLPIKKAGDYPEFWQKNTPFTDIMAEFYDRMRKVNKL